MLGLADKAMALAMARLTQLCLPLSISRVDLRGSKHTREAGLEKEGEPLEPAPPGESWSRIIVLSACFSTLICTCVHEEQTQGRVVSTGSKKQKTLQTSLQYCKLSTILQTSLQYRVRY